MFLTKLTVFAISAAALTTSLSAAAFDAKVRNDFFSGFLGNRAALDRGLAKAEAAIAADPQGSAEALAWHGSGLLYLAGLKFREGDSAAGMDLWGKATTEMQKAGAMEPDNPGVLIPRAAAWFAASRNSPPAMARPILTQALADYEHVFELQKAYFETLGIHLRSELLFGLADGYNRAGNAEKGRFFFEKLAALGPESGHLDQAKQFLAGYKYTVTGAGCAGCHTGK